MKPLLPNRFKLPLRQLCCLFLFLGLSAVKPVSLQADVINHDSIFDLLKKANGDTLIARYFKLLKSVEANNDKKKIAGCYIFIGNTCADYGYYEIAIDYYTAALKVNREINYQDGIGSCYNNIGLVYSEQGIFDKAIACYMNALKINEATGNKINLSNNYNNIGLVHYEQGNYEKAAGYYQKSLQIDSARNDKQGISACYNNLGLVFAGQKLYEKAIGYYSMSYNISLEIKDKRGMAKCLNNMGHIYEKQGKYEKAIEHYLKSLKMGEELGDKNGIATVWSNLASLHTVIADSSRSRHEKQKHYNEAIVYGLKAYALAKEIAAITRVNAAALNLQKAYTKTGNAAKALEFAEIYIATNDSLFNEEKTKALAGMEARYKDEKKQLEIDKLAKEKELQALQVKKQQMVIWFMVFGLVFIAVISVVLFRLFLHKKKANVQLKFLNSELSQKNEEISAQRDEIEAQRDEILTANETLHQQKEEISAQRDEIETQRDVATRQRDLITHQKKELTDSINYAERIQHAILPPDYYVKKCLNDYFILYLPKDVVSGDFYFVEQIENHIIFSAVDCTGHGVPGAMMSVIGYNLLNHAVKLNRLTKPSEILSFLDAGVTETLRQTFGESGVNDGMDIAVCSLDLNTLNLQFAGAYNSVVLVQQAVLKEIKADNIPIGVNYDGKVDTYTNHEIQLQPGDCIYMYSDGYADQFGGPKGKKFKYKQLKELLVSNSNNPMGSQQESLKAVFDGWKGSLEQVDDVVVIGMRV